MSEKTFTVPNISCGHCVHTIKTELQEIPGVKAVQADPGTKQVSVTWEAPASWEKIESTLTEINFPPAQLIQLG
jgi:copper chaperone